MGTNHRYPSRHWAALALARELGLVEHFRHLEMLKNLDNGVSSHSSTLRGDSVDAALRFSLPTMVSTRYCLMKAVCQDWLEMIAIGLAGCRTHHCLMKEVDQDWLEMIAFGSAGYRIRHCLMEGVYGDWLEMTAVGSADCKTQPVS